MVLEKRTDSSISSTVVADFSIIVIDLSPLTAQCSRANVEMFNLNISTFWQRHKE